jgi:hypothetical protein
MSLIQQNVEMQNIDSKHQDKTHLLEDLTEKKEE